MTNKKAIMLLCTLIPLMSYGISEKDSVSELREALPMHALKVYPLALFSNYFNTNIITRRMNAISYERKLYKNSTLSLSVSGSIGRSSIGSTNQIFFEFGGELEYRYYIKDALKGWYVGAMFLYSINSWKITEPNISIYNTPIDEGSRIYVNTISMGSKFGYQFLWKKKKGFFTLDLGSGLGYTHIFYENNSERILTVNRLGLFFDVGLGYSFYKIKKVK